jgi:UDP-N-acetylglucosamine diphosphorylase/glucosamine-1-phosphate N-acetyltransferase
MSKNISIVILAAGKGKRMDSDIPKVLHKLKGVSLIDRVINTTRKLNTSKIIVVVGHKKELIKKSLESENDIEYAVQNEQKGTAHAVKMCFENLKNFDGDIIILSGDVPLISIQTLKKLVKMKNIKNAKASILTADMENPDGYGRVIRSTKGHVIQMKEHKDCNNSELLNKEINAGIYVIENSCLFNYIPKINNKNVQGEYYLPDLINLMIRDGKSIATYKTTNIQEISGINNKNQLKDLESYLKKNDR